MEGTYPVANLELLDAGTDFDDRTRRSITQYLGVGDKESTIILVQVHGRGCSPFDSHPDFAITRGNSPHLSGLERSSD